jgi:hypothetical protein
MPTQILGHSRTGMEGKPIEVADHRQGSRLGALWSACTTRGSSARRSSGSSAATEQVTFAAIGPGQPDVPNGNDNESIERKRKP